MRKSSAFVPHDIASAIRGSATGPLAGLTVAVKDMYDIEGERTGGGSPEWLATHAPAKRHAAAVARLLEAGASVIGKTVCDEFFFSLSGANAHYGTPVNVRAMGRLPGGSSAGSAAAVAAGACDIALGSDTGGSIRQPASFCGIVGLKPTYGLVSRYGLVAFASSLDQIGPFARTVEDAALLLGAIAGHDALDSTSCPISVPDYRAELARRPGPWKLGVPKEYFGAGLDSEVGDAIRAAIEFYRAAGCEIREISLPVASEYAIAVYYIIATAEASSNLARYDGIRYGHRSADATDAIDIYFKSRAEGFGPEVKRRIILGTHVLSSGYYDAYYLRAQKVRTLIRNDFLRAFQEVDALLAPVAPTAAFRQGEKSSDPLAMYLSDIYTISLNLAGLPGISIPCGFTRGGLPIGLQIIGQPFQEANLLAIARSYEQAHDWHLRHPVL